MPPGNNDFGAWVVTRDLVLGLFDQLAQQRWVWFTHTKRGGERVLIASGKPQDDFLGLAHCVSTGSRVCTSRTR